MKIEFRQASTLTCLVAMITAVGLCAYHQMGDTLKRSALSGEYAVVSATTAPVRGVQIHSLGLSRNKVTTYIEVTEQQYRSASESRKVCLKDGQVQEMNNVPCPG